MSVRALAAAVPLDHARRALARGAPGGRLGERVSTLVAGLDSSECCAASRSAASKSLEDVEMERPASRSSSGRTPPGRAIIDAAAADTSDPAADASRDLPQAARLTDLLTETSMRTPAFDVDDDTVIEDSLPIARIEPAKLWFGGHGPIDVPRRASDLAQIGWEAWVVLAHHGERWWLLENGIVYA